MKKMCSLLSLIFVLMCSGCGPTKKPLLEGTFYSIEVSSKNEDMKDKFSEAKVTIKEITKEEYEEANGVNVLIDGYTSQIEEKRYLSIELYLYAIETAQYELVTLYELHFLEGTQQMFHSKAYLKINDNEYQDNSDALHLTENGPWNISVFDMYINFRYLN